MKEMELPKKKLKFALIIELLLRMLKEEAEVGFIP
jgi:hypothetical protein